jgi:prolipoprotein diacylglyceryl transferase
LTLLATIPSPPSNVIHVGPLAVNFYGLAIALGVVAAAWLLRRRYAAAGGDSGVTDRVVLWAVVAGIVGARVAFVSTNLQQFTERPWAVIAVWEGGLAFFGGLVAGTLAVLWVLRREEVGLARFADAAAPAIPLGHAIGRWGCYFNQELYGRPTDLPWGLQIDHEPLPVHPTFLYESIGNLLLVAALILLGRRRGLAGGSLIFAYFAGYGFLRFWVELLRVDTEYRLLGLSRNNWVALVVFLGGMAGLVWWQRRVARRAVGPPEQQPTGALPAGSQVSQALVPSDPSSR